jgi:hypothetical protein
MARRKRVEPDLAAWAKAHEAEAKRAAYHAKSNAGGAPAGHTWQTYAARCIREAAEVSRRDPLPLELDLTPAPIPAEVTPVNVNSWRDHLLALDALDAARFTAARQ